MGITLKNQDHILSYIFSKSNVNTDMGVIFRVIYQLTNGSYSTEPYSKPSPIHFQQDLPRHIKCSLSDTKIFSVFFSSNMFVQEVLIVNAIQIYIFHK